jgi:hypothetical protein
MQPEEPVIDVPDDVPNPGEIITEDPDIRPDAIVD